jgi:hypothetical protein
MLMLMMLCSSFSDSNTRGVTFETLALKIDARVVRLSFRFVFFVLFCSHSFFCIFLHSFGTDPGVPFLRFS